MRPPAAATGENRITFLLLHQSDNLAPWPSRQGPPRQSATRSGFTLVEMLVATAVTLVMMAVVVGMFAVVTESISDNRAEIEMAEQLRAVQHRLQKDLAGITVTVDPPRRPEAGEGYFEYIEGADFFPRSNYTPPADRLTVRVNVAADGQVLGPTHPVNVDDPAAARFFDSTLGDHDVLMFTTRSRDEPFVGRAGINKTVQSDVAEVRYFVRGRTLYRGQRLVRPDIDLLNAATAGYYAHFDVAAHQVGRSADDTAGAGAARLVASTLGDLTKREYRFAHQPLRWPHDARFWRHLGLPTMAECSHPAWPFPYYESTSPVPNQVIRPPDNNSEFGTGNAPLLLTLSQGVDSESGQTVDVAFDPWENSPQGLAGRLYPWQQLDAATGVLTRDPNDPAESFSGPRTGEDVIANNILSFDVKLWDPGAPIFEDVDKFDNPVAVMPGDPGYQDLIDDYDGTTPADDDGNTPVPIGFGAYVDLGYALRDIPQATAAPEAVFDDLGDTRSALHVAQDSNGNPIDGIFVYDTGSFHYEGDGKDQDNDGTFDQATNGTDDDNAFGVDDPGELEAPPPYAVPAESMQIRIRMFEPDTRQIREVTIVHRFSRQ